MQEFLLYHETSNLFIDFYLYFPVVFYLQCSPSLALARSSVRLDFASCFFHSLVPSLHLTKMEPFAELLPSAGIGEKPQNSN